MNLCAGCHHNFRDDDVAPCQRNADGTLEMACRRCIGEWVQMGALWNHMPFWFRKAGRDVLHETYLAAEIRRPSESAQSPTPPPEGRNTQDTEEGTPPQAEAQGS